MNINISQKNDQKETSSQDLDISAQTTVRLILQFLREQNLSQSLKCLQQETGVYLSAVDSKSEFIEDVSTGNMKRLLNICNQCLLPEQVRFEVFEHICFELIDANSMEAFNKFFNESAFSKSFDITKTDFASRIAILKQAAISRNNVALWSGSTKPKRRRHIAKTVASHLLELPPNSLLKIMTSSSQLDKQLQLPLMNNNLPPTRQGKTLNLPRSFNLTSVLFLENTNIIACGLQTGRVELLNWQDGSQVPADLYHPTGHTITALAQSADGQVLASADSSGSVRLWKLKDFELGLEIKQIHVGAITSLVFHPSQPILLTTGTDNTTKTTMITSSAVTLCIRAPSEDTFIRTALYDRAKHIITWSTDSTLRWYSAKTGVLSSSKTLRDGNEQYDKCVGYANLITCTAPAHVAVATKKGDKLDRFEQQENESYVDAVALDDSSLLCLTNKKYYVVDRFNRKIIFELPVEKCDNMCLHPQGQALALWQHEGNRISILLNAI